LKVKWLSTHIEQHKSSNRKIQNNLAEFKAQTKHLEKHLEEGLEECFGALEASNKLLKGEAKELREKDKELTKS
jgi:hypothetical protein